MPVYHAGTHRTFLEPRSRRCSTALFKLKQNADPERVLQWTRLAHAMVGNVPGKWCRPSSVPHTSMLRHACHARLNGSTGRVARRCYGDLSLRTLTWRLLCYLTTLGVLQRSVARSPDTVLDTGQANTSAMSMPADAIASLAGAIIGVSTYQAVSRLQRTPRSSERARVLRNNPRTLNLLAV